MTTQHQESGGIGSGVGLTALAAAAGRAVESSRPDRLIDDPYAAFFVEASPASLPLPVRWPDEDAELSRQEVLLLLGANYVGLRSRFFDDFLCDAWAADTRQAVIFAAGLDTRAYRLDWPPSFHLFEIDQPGVLKFKDTVLRDIGAHARCAHTVIAVDLRDDWPRALRDTDFDPAAPTVWIAEGLLQYLSAADEQRLLATMDELSAPGSLVAVERSVNLASRDEESMRRAREVSHDIGIPMDQLIHTDRRPDPTAWLAAHGWAATDEPVHAVAERYRRDLTYSRLISRIQAAADGNDRPAPAQPKAGFTTASKH